MIFIGHLVTWFS